MVEGGCAIVDVLSEEGPAGRSLVKTAVGGSTGGKATSETTEWPMVCQNSAPTQNANQTINMDLLDGHSVRIGDHTIC